MTKISEENEADEKGKVKKISQQEKNNKWIPFPSYEYVNVQRLFSYTQNTASEKWKTKARKIQLKKTTSNNESLIESK